MATSDIGAWWKWYIFAEHHRSFGNRMVNNRNASLCVTAFIQATVATLSQHRSTSIFFIGNFLSMFERCVFFSLFSYCRCDGITSVPLLVPLTGWLPYPLPSQVNWHYSISQASQRHQHCDLFSCSFFFSLRLDTNDDGFGYGFDPFHCNGTIETAFGHCTTSWWRSTMAYYEQ